VYEIQMSEIAAAVHLRDIKKKLQAANPAELLYRAHNLCARKREPPPLSTPGERPVRGSIGAVSQ
jgi:hypothetical protein